MAGEREWEPQHDQEAGSSFGGVRRLERVMEAQALRLQVAPRLGSRLEAGCEGQGRGEEDFSIWGTEQLGE